MNKPLSLLFCLLVQSVSQAIAQDGGNATNSTNAPASVQKTTYNYAEKNSRELLLDRIVDTAVKAAGKQPVLMFSFGGGWEGGARDDQGIVPVLNYFASLGYTVVAIDYRLGVKEAKAEGRMTEANGTEIYLQAIQMGVEDLFDATSFVVNHCDEWNIDAQEIVIMGGSAGATNSLVAEWNVANGTDLAKAHLPENFRYAGVISMAGAFWFKANTPLTFATRPAPIMFFHGAKDQLVTYDEFQGHFSGYGPAYYFREFKGPDYPKWFVDYPQGDHVVAGSPVVDCRHEIEAFLQKLVHERQEVSVHTVEEDRIPKNFANFLLWGDRVLSGPKKSEAAE